MCIAKDARVCVNRISPNEVEVPFEHAPRFFFTQKVIFLAQHFYLIMYTTAIEQIPLVQTSIFSATNMTFLVYHPIAFDRQIIVSLSVTLSFSKSLKEIFMSPLQIKGNASFGGICQFLSSGYQTRNSVLF